EGSGERTDWRRTLRRYRLLLYEEGTERKGEEGETIRRGIPEEEARKVVDGTAIPSVPEVLRRRVRYFSDGAALGTAAFVEGAFERLRERGRASPKRSTGARRMRGASWGELRVLR